MQCKFYAYLPISELKHHWYIAGIVAYVIYLLNPLFIACYIFDHIHTENLIHKDVPKTQHVSVNKHKSFKILN